jgi:hypothetical protein
MGAIGMSACRKQTWDLLFDHLGGTSRTLTRVSSIGSAEKTKCLRARKPILLVDSRMRGRFWLLKKSPPLVGTFCVLADLIAGGRSTMERAGRMRLSALTSMTNNHGIATATFAVARHGGRTLLLQIASSARKYPG